MNHASAPSVIDLALRLPVFHAEWVFWLLLVLSVASIAVTLERALFYRARRVDVDALELALRACTNVHDAETFAASLDERPALELLVLRAALSRVSGGREALLDVVAAVLGRERQRYDQRLAFLATIASNAPFIGLFGTVLGIIHAFQDLSQNIADASTSVMAGVAEALVSTAVGLLVAIPAVIAYTVFKSREKTAVGNAGALVHLTCALLPGGR